MKNSQIRVVNNQVQKPSNKNQTMTIESFIDHVSRNIEHMSSGASVLDAPIPNKQLVKEFETTLSELVDTCNKISVYYNDETEKIEKTVCDMQHLTVFAKLAIENDRPITEFLGGDKALPAELKDVPLEEYGDVLVNTLYKRRQLKDTNIMFKVTKERLEHILKFVRGMNTRTYELRSKEPGELNRSVQYNMKGDDYNK